MAQLGWFAVLGAALAIAACGSSKKSSSASGSSSSSATASNVAVSISESGKKASYTAPSSVKGGLVKLTLHNAGKQPHGAQLVLVTGSHTTQQASEAVNDSNDKTPSWTRGEGGIGPVAPGQTQSATLNLPAGKYLLTDAGGPGSSAPSASTSLTVTAGTNGSLPSTPTTVTAASTGRDKYEWRISGPLKAGANQVTFDSKGDNTIHLIAAVRITGNHSQAQIQKALATNGKPPSYVDMQSFTNTAVLDSGKSETTPLTFSKPGKYVVFCPITDRDGGKQHDQEGLLTTVSVK